MGLWLSDDGAAPFLIFAILSFLAITKFSTFDIYFRKAIFMLLKGERLDIVNDNLSLIQKEGGMTFGTDALLLAAFVHPCPAGYGIEFGAGSGIVSMLCATRQKLARITCVEVQEEYASLCQRNVTYNGLDDKISVWLGDVRHMTQAEVPGDAHVVFANPPYMKVDTGYEASDKGRNIARHEVFGGIYDFCKAASSKLRWGGKFYVVWRPDRLIDLLVCLRENNLEPKKMTFVSAKVGVAPSIVLTEARLGGRPGLITTPTLYLSNAEGAPTKEMQIILDGGPFPY